MVMTALVLLSTAVLSLVFLELLLQQVLHDADKRANEMARQIFHSAQLALEDAKAKGMRPTSDDPQETQDYVRRAFEINEALSAQLQAAQVAPTIREATVVDRDGTVIVSSDPALPGKLVPKRPPFNQLVQSPFVRQVRILAEQEHIYEVDYPFTLRGMPFGDVRVAVSTALLWNDIKPRLERWGSIALLALVLSTFLAAVVSGVALAPIRDISAQLDRISAGEYDTASATAKDPAESMDELGQVRRKIKQVGQHLRGVHEIFSSLRENMNSVMAGLEDGLILFTRDARAVMVSPAAEMNCVKSLRRRTCKRSMGESA
jgi:hypothetical protein